MRYFLEHWCGSRNVASYPTARPLQGGARVWHTSSMVGIDDATSAGTPLVALWVCCRSPGGPAGRDQIIDDYKFRPVAEVRTLSLSLGVLSRAGRCPWRDVLEMSDGHCHFAHAIQHHLAITGIWVPVVVPTCKVGRGRSSESDTVPDPSINSKISMTKKILKKNKKK